MTETAETPLSSPSIPELVAEERAPGESRLARWLDVLIRGVGPVALALIAGGILLLALGRNPVSFYSDIYQGGITHDAWEDTVMRMAPLLLIAAGLIFIFRANLWNLGYDGQFMLAAAMIAGIGPKLEGQLPVWLSLVLLFIVAGVTGALWALIPALLKAYSGVNEIITTLMMSFIGLSLANVLIKGPFQDPTINTPQTVALPLSGMLPNIPHTRVHVGILVAIGMILIVHYVLTRTSLGLRLQVLGANTRTAVHAGIGVKRLIVTAFLVSGALIGLAAAAEILGIWGYVRADTNFQYGDAVIPFVFLARLNALAVVPFVAFYSLLAIGGEQATQNANLPTDFLLVIVGLILLFMSLTEYFGRKRDLGGSYLTVGLLRSLKGKGVLAGTTQPSTTQTDG
jgi:simple sugar transport system permease protein